MAEKPPSVSHLEKMEPVHVSEKGDEEIPTPPEQDWTKEEEKALVFAFSARI